MLSNLVNIQVIPEPLLTTFSVMQFQKTISGNITTVLNCFDIDWPNILKLDEENVNSATKNFLYTINSVLKKYAPLKKVNKYKLRLKKETLDYFWHSKITLH